MKPIIRVENLSKQYIIGGKKESYETFRESLVNAARSPLNALKRRAQRNGNSHFWALKDVSFEISPGEVVGIIGRNGAGKSTLLKILSRITEPTEGRIELYGRIGSLLEVGTGFHPELTGRENIYLNGAILGMRREEISKKFDEIVDFAEIEDFLDTPVKRYSSGMYVRLAFAVAAHLEPEVLIVDEVLAVGDAEFQKKCLGKMDDVSKTGKTVLFVSHQMGTIAQLCQKTILLEKGQLVMFGKTSSVIDHYLNTQAQNDPVYKGDREQSANKAAYFEYVKMINDAGLPIKELPFDQSILLEFKIAVNKWHKNLELGFSLQDATRKRIFTIHYNLDRLISSTETQKVIRLQIPANFITPGFYSWIVATFIQGTELIDVQLDICSFNIIDTGSQFAKYEGVDYGCVFVNNYKFLT